MYQPKLSSVMVVLLMVPNANRPWTTWSSPWTIIVPVVFSLIEVVKQLLIDG